MKITFFAILFFGLSSFIQDKQTNSPNIYASVIGKTSGLITNEEASRIFKIYIKGDSASTYSIYEFKFLLFQNGNLFEHVSKSDTLPDRIKEYLRRSRIDDKIFFQNIYCTNGKDTLTLGPLSFTIKRSDVKKRNY